MGAIDGTHVEIIKPSCENAFDYFSRKQKYTISNQAICDGNLMFLAVDSGFPGSIHDARMLEHTWISKAATEHSILRTPSINVNGKEVTPYVIGDPAYPLQEWLIKTYPEGKKNTQKGRFNLELCKGRVHIERTFRLLKKCWTIRHI